MSSKVKSGFLIFLLLNLSSALAGELPVTLIRGELQKKYPGTQIELTGKASSVDGVFTEASLMEDNGLGTAKLVLRGTDAHGAAKSQILSTNFSAWTKGWVAKKRITPGEKLVAADFVQQKIDVASGMAREFRGLLLPIKTDLSKLQTVQTIVEGNAVLLTQVDKIPDVKKGDTVRVRIISGKITLSTQGEAEESGRFGDSIRVLTDKTKRELKGLLSANGIVEVRL